ncbi:LysR family transcriptional regulator [Bradyrhizobium diazoefficiens]|nr:LysR family transcriptional regulator [Bradyrhizobium diazoefficiens]QQN62314.1 LysR family transcriptional regulator [Bradyrhizobium diazoefficiens]
MSLFEDMTAFVYAAEAQSFSGAARRLGIAKSIVSRRMNSLEDRLGTSLFNRTTRRLSLTETGRAYFERARRILADVTDAEDVTRHLQGEVRGRLKVAAPMSFGVQHLAPAVTEFLTAHPQVEIELDLNDRCVDVVSDGYDLAVQIGELPDSSLIVRTLAPCRHVVCASPTYLAAHGEPGVPSDLVKQGHDCLVYSNRPALEQWRFRIAGKWQEVSVVACRLGANSAKILMDAAIAGLGLAVLPTFVVSDALVSGQLTQVLGDYEFYDPSIRVVWPQNRQLSAKVRAFVDFLGARFGGVPYWDKAIANGAARQLGA